MRLSKACFQFVKVPQNRKEYFARKLVGFSDVQMFTVVADIKNYKKFVPFCTKSTVLSSQPHVIFANLEVGFPPVFENYTSEVTQRKPHYLRAVCRDGKLFTYLETSWKFNHGLRSNPQSCIVDFYINFEFKSLFYSKIATLFFDQLVAQMEGAFIDEARRRYGKESLPVHRLEPIKQ